MRSFVYFIFLLAGIPALAQDHTGHHRDFDFWLGEWNVYKTGTDTLVGQSQIEPVLDSTAIRETYRSTRGPYAGSSTNVYNSSTDSWEQYWTDNFNLVLHLSGGLQHGSMVLEDTPFIGSSVNRNRITWTPAADGTVRQLWEQSTDGGISWQTAFDGTYRRK